MLSKKKNSSCKKKKNSCCPNQWIWGPCPPADSWVCPCPASRWSPCCPCTPARSSQSPASWAACTLARTTSCHWPSPANSRIIRGQSIFQQFVLLLKKKISCCHISPNAFLDSKMIHLCPLTRPNIWGDIWPIWMRWVAWPTWESKQAAKMWQLDFPAAINGSKWISCKASPFLAGISHSCFPRGLCKNKSYLLQQQCSKTRILWRKYFGTVYIGQHVLGKRWQSNSYQIR